MIARAAASGKGSRLLVGRRVAAGQGFQRQIRAEQHKSSVCQSLRKMLLFGNMETWMEELGLVYLSIKKIE